MDDPIVTMRMQYVEDLEDILQCPVCWNLPAGAIITCMKGHHICEYCKKTNGINVCPTCNSNFNGSRNYLAENLSSKFEDIKTSILDPAHYINRKIVKKCIETQTASTKVNSVNTQTEVNDNFIATQATQTETNVIDVATQTDEEKREYELWPITVKGNNNSLHVVYQDGCRDECQIPCLLENCNDLYTHDNIVNHIDLNHKDNLIEVNSSENGSYNFEWNALYEKNKSSNYAINILDLGLFFIKIFIDDDGNLHGNIEVANKYRNSREFYYILLITNAATVIPISYSGIVPDHSTTRRNNNSIFIDNKHFSEYLSSNLNKSFEYTLTLYRPEN